LKLLLAIKWSIQSKLLAALVCDAGKNWDEGGNFNGCAASEIAMRLESRDVNGTYCE